MGIMAISKKERPRKITYYLILIPSHHNLLDSFINLPKQYAIRNTHTHQPHPKPKHPIPYQMTRYSENKIPTTNMDTKAPTTSTNITLDHPYHDLQTTVLQLTEQVKQLQRELGVQIGKFNERVRPLEAYLKKEEKKNQKIEEVRRGRGWRCGTGDIIMEQNRKREKENQKNGEVEWGFLMGGGAKREVRKKSNVEFGPDRIIVWNEKGMKEGEGKEGVGEPSRGGRVSGSCQALREALEEQK